MLKLQKMLSSLVVVLVFPAVYGRYDHAAREAFIKEHPNKSFSSYDVSEVTVDEVAPADATEPDEE